MTTTTTPYPKKKDKPWTGKEDPEEPNDRTVQIQLVNNVLVGWEEGHQYDPILIAGTSYLLPITVCSHDTPAKKSERIDLVIGALRQKRGWKNAVIHYP